MKPRSLHAAMKTSVLLSTGLIAASVVWLIGLLGDRPAAAADADGSDPAIMRLTAPLAPDFIDQLPETSVLADDGSSAIPLSNPAFARLISGVWVEWIEVEIEGEFLYAQTMFNIRADGTLDWFGSWFFGNGSEAFLDGPVYCAWKQTGPREITSIQVGFLFNGDGSFSGTGRVQMEITFDEDLQSFSYSGMEEILTPDQDPADPDAVPADSFSFGNYAPVNRLNYLD